MTHDYFVYSDGEIRSALKKKVLAKHLKRPETLVVDELGLEFGIARIDVAVIGHRLVGYEIKSDADSLYRLQEQIRIYNRVLDRVVLVVGYRHAYQALKLIPDWWGVRLVSRAITGQIKFSEARQARDNPSLTPDAIARLLWRDELISILVEIHAVTGMRSKTRDVLCTQLAESLSLDELRSRVREKLRHRANWRVDPAPT